MIIDLSKYEIISCEDNNLVLRCRSDNNLIIKNTNDSILFKLDNSLANDINEVNNPANKKPNEVYNPDNDLNDLSINPANEKFNEVYNPANDLNDLVINPANKTNELTIKPANNLANKLNPNSAVNIVSLLQYGDLLQQIINYKIDLNETIRYLISYGLYIELKLLYELFRIDSKCNKEDLIKLFICINDNYYSQNNIDFNSDSYTDLKNINIKINNILRGYGNDLMLKYYMCIIRHDLYYLIKDRNNSKKYLLAALKNLEFFKGFKSFEIFIKSTNIESEYFIPMMYESVMHDEYCKFIPVIIDNRDICGIPNKIGDYKYEYELKTGHNMEEAYQKVVKAYNL
jgi:hypothetical protein